MDRREQQKIARRAVRRLDELLHQVEKAFETLMEDSHHGAPTSESEAWADLEMAESLGSTNPHWKRARRSV